MSKLLRHQAIDLLQGLQVLVDQAVDHTATGFHLVDLADDLATDVQGDITSRVSSLLVANLPTGNYSKEEAARALHMSPRTLQKKLQEAKTTWRELVDHTRYELALSYLESGRYSLSEITYMLGFNDSSSFSRAFKRWSGQAPGEYRA